jgi:hypothetical protein
MAEIQTFAHGRRYGDYSGVVFRSSGTKAGYRREQLAVSDCYIHPLFHAILDRAEREPGETKLPRLVSHWNTGEGWAAGPDASPILPAHLTEFLDALARLQSADLAPHCAGCTAEECMRCAAAIGEFIESHLARQAVITLEED